MYQPKRWCIFDPSLSTSTGPKSTSGGASATPETPHHIGGAGVVVLVLVQRASLADHVVVLVAERTR